MLMEDALSRYPRSLADGLRIRPLRADDEAALAAFFARIPVDERKLFKDDVTRIETIRGWIRNLNYENILPLLVFEGLCAAVSVEQCFFEQAAVPLFDIEIAEDATVKDLVFINPRFEKPGPQGQTFEIRVPAPGTNGLTELQIVGGTVIFGGSTSGMKPVRVDGYGTGSAPYMMMPGSGLRLRLPSLTTADVLALPDPRGGDLVYDQTANRPKFYNPQLGWIAL